MNRNAPTHRSEAVAGLGPMISQRGALALLILVELVAFSVFSETIVVPVLIGLAAIVGWQRPLHYQISADRQVIVALLIGVIFIAGWRFDPHQQAEDAIPFFSPFLHALGQYLLVLQTAALYVAHDRDLLPVTLPWPGVFVMVAAGDVDATEGQRALFQVLAILFAVASAFYFSATAGRTAGRRQMRWEPRRSGLMAVILVLIAVAAWIGSTALHRYEQELNRLVSRMLAPTVGSAGAGFPSNSALGSIAERKSMRADDIALRIVSSSRPGYWRGKVYYWLVDVPGMRAPRVTQWSPTPPRKRVRGEATPRRRLSPTGRAGADYRYVLKESAERPRTPQFSVWLEAPLWGVYFLPEDVVTVMTAEGAIERRPGQVRSLDGREVVHYSVGTGAVDAANAVVRPGDGPAWFSRAALTSYPRHPATAGGDPRIQQIVETVFADCQSVSEHIAAVEDYFHENYEYHQGITVPTNVDPIEWFLRMRPAAHCEFFAQGAALLLRMRGIPTRYVTGFVVAEQNHYGDYWIARNEDAHAWCEAWDPARGWVIVEATPPAGIPDANPAPWHQQAWEYVHAALREFRYQFQHKGWRWLARRIWDFLKTPAGWLVLTVIAGYLALRVVMLLAERSGRNLPRAVRQMHRLLRRMDRRMERRGFVRAGGETLNRFADRIADTSDNSSAADWYRAYAATRYGGPLNEGRLTMLREALTSGTK